MKGFFFFVLRIRFRCILERNIGSNVGIETQSSVSKIIKKNNSPSPSMVIQTRLEL